jgi:hypothetical protein
MNLMLSHDFARIERAQGSGSTPLEGRLMSNDDV